MTIRNASRRGVVIRWMTVVVVLVAIALTPALISTVRGQGSNPAQTQNFRDQARYMISDLADQVIPSIVTIYVKEELSQQQKEQLKQFQRFFDRRGMDPFFRQFFDDGGGDNDDNDQSPQPSPRIKIPDRLRSGSGIILSDDGLIITNAHVLGQLNGNTDVRVVFSDNEEISGKDIKLVANQDFLDLAIIKVNTSKLKTKLQPIKWGDSDKLRIGEMVATVGSPLDLRMTVTQGIVCAKFRNIDDAYGLGDLIQTDAVINPGSSGGALVNMDGEMVGINRLITTNTGMWSGYGFAIPSNDARDFADKVLKTGKAVYGYIGVGMKNEITADDRKAIGIDPETKGILVENVTPNGPAEKAGIQAYDFITQVGDKPFAANKQNDINNELLRQVMRHNPGDKVGVTVLRGGGRAKPEQKEFTITVGTRPTQEELRKLMGMQPEMRPTPEARTEGREMLGLTLEPYSKDGVRGLRITAIKPDSPAAEQRLQPGDVITQVNREPVQSVSDLNKAIKDRPKDVPNLIQFLRDGKPNIAVVPQE
ncbi:trypsin-like peptidase domain-containing protein [bacterium]|nr:trypsin-like peptidase domain-containing protein [bacterium]